MRDAQSGCDGRGRRGSVSTERPSTTLAFAFVDGRAVRATGAARLVGTDGVLRGAVRTTVVVAEGCARGAGGGGDAAAVDGARAAEGEGVAAATGASGVGTGAAAGLDLVVRAAGRACAAGAGLARRSRLPAGRLAQAAETRLRHRRDR